MKPETLLIYYNSDVNVDISYQFGWVKAFRKSSFFNCDYLNLSNFFPIYKKKPRLEEIKNLLFKRYDHIILLHSAFSNACLIPYYVQKILRHKKANKIFFIGNEYKHMPEKINFTKFCRIKVFVTHTYCDDAINIYKKNLPDCKILSIPAGGLDTEIFYPGKEFEKRKIDLGSRAYDEPYYFGHQERSNLMYRVKDIANELGLSQDLSMEQKDRFVGNDWANFLRNIKSMPATNSGNDYFEIDDSTRNKVNKFCIENPDTKFEEIFELFFKNKRKVPNRQITGKHIEAAGTKTLLILLEGNYGGYFLPNVHFLEIKKDFSNLRDVIKKLDDKELCKKIINNAYNVAVKELKFDDHIEYLYKNLS